MKTSLDNHLMANVELRDACREEFALVFGVPLAQYWDNLLGFNIVKFDDKVVKSGRRAMIGVVLLC